MRHKIIQFVILFTALAPSTLFAQSRPFRPISESLARKAALTYAERELRISNPEIEEMIPYPNKKLSTLRIYNFKTGGWIVMSNGRNTPPVMAFSNKHHFEQNKSSNWFLTGYSKTVTMASGRTVHPSWKSLLSINTSSAHTASPVYLQYGPYTDDILWNQNAFFNDTVSQRIQDKDDQTAVGCVAVAAGIVLRYHGLPYVGVGSSSHIYNGFTYITDHDYPHLLDSSSLGTSDPNHQGEVARFLYDLGVGLKMDWGPASISHLSDVAPLYRDHYYTDVNKIIAMEDYPTTATWLDAFKHELMNKRPSIYGGFQEGGNVGHAWVNDGIKIQADGTYLHFNLGWGGSSNGWYTLDNMPDDYLEFNVAIIGIEPRKPDLTAEIQLNGLVYETGSSSFNTTIKNTGYSPSGATNFELYASKNNQLDTSDSLIYIGNFNELGLGQKVNLNGSFRLPSTFHGDEFYIIAKADGQDRIAETNEANNTSSLLVSNIDYVPVALSAQSAIFSPGDQVKFRFSVKNIGTTNSIDWTTAKVLLSKTRNSTSNAQVLKALDVSPLSANTTSSQISVGLALDSDLDPGTYYIFCQVDADYEINERDESNNKEFLTIRIKRSGGFKTENYTSVEQSNIEGSDLLIYPNPVQGNLTIDVGDLQGTLTIRDLTGRVVSKQSMEGSTQLGTEFLEDGTYLISFISASGTLHYNTFVKH